MNKIFARKGFTLVELLVVIAIIAIIAAIVILIVNPIEVTRRAKDATRLADIVGVQNAINVTVQESTVSGAAVLCNGGSTPCRGESTIVGAENSNGTGWVKVNLQLQSAVSVPNLPNDPVDTDGPNSGPSQGYHFTYCSDGLTWEINTNLESALHKPREGTDGGNANDVAGDAALYETGSDPGLDLIPASCTWD